MLLGNADVAGVDDILAAGGRCVDPTDSSQSATP